ncbi:MAG: hypothetical protein C4K60_14600 [Ideonella sp. MAG2]|nr:MAG: hypothetical protein C4K60_14600 [Ideonella sp. MAG2]
MDFDKIHAKCFAALPKIAKGDVPAKLLQHAQTHLAECEECREELARLKAGGEPRGHGRGKPPATLSALPSGPIPVTAGVPSPPTPLVATVQPSLWLRWAPVLLGLLVLETSLLGWILFQSGQPLSVFMRCMAGGA